MEVARDQRGEPDLPPGPARELVDLFRQLRHARQLSGGQIAIKTGLSPSHVSDVLRGWKAPSPDAAGKIATALGASHDTTLATVRLAEDLRELNRHNRRRERDATLRAPGGESQAASDPVAASAAPVSVADRRPRPLSSSEICLYRVTGLAGPADRHLGTVSGDLRRVRCADVWVNSENTEMTMARFDEFSVSSIIRYEGARATTSAGSSMTSSLTSWRGRLRVADRCCLRRPSSPDRAS
jgi:transcriptional regulator with XRE-family HTH domain